MARILPGLCQVLFPDPLTALASANPPSVDPSPDPTVDVNTAAVTGEPVSPQELNSWRRGFTPQAEIWNGRLAMVGLSVGLTVLLVARLAAHHP